MHTYLYALRICIHIYISVRAWRLLQVGHVGHISALMCVHIHTFTDTDVMLHSRQMFCMCIIVYAYMLSYRYKLISWQHLSDAQHCVFMCTSMHNIHLNTCRSLAEAELKVAKAEKTAAVLKGVARADLDSFQQSIDSAKENLAEAKLLVSIARNSTRAEGEARSQLILLMRSSHLNCLPVSGNNC
jgi:hypothetical protein